MPSLCLTRMKKITQTGKCGSPGGLSPLSSGLSCVPVLPPRRGSFYVESGTGVSIGTVLTFWCKDGYQLVGSDKIYCDVRNGKLQWSNYPPVCEAIPRPEDRGLRVAVLASVVSGIVILAMSLSFLICCLQERSSRDRLHSFLDVVPGITRKLSANTEMHNALSYCC
uniref:Zgc:162331 n=1 Tax=Echeneis naucrates TaxID=173247 RepID=A0A665UKI9_ECHNA